MTLLTRDQILGANDLPSEDVKVPEWGGTVRVRGLTGTERDRWEFRMASAAKSGKDPASIRSQLAAQCIVDEEDRRIFTDKDVGGLGRKSGIALNRVFETIRRLSGMDDESLNEAVEDFEDAPSDGSSSD